MFTCNKNKFLASVINSKNINEVFFTYNINGHTSIFSNIEILNIFFKTANKKQLIQAQQILQQDKFSEKAINNFVYHFAEEFLIKNKGK